MTAPSTHFRVSDDEIFHQDTVVSGGEQHGNLPVQENLIPIIDAYSEILARWTASYDLLTSKSGQVSFALSGMLPDVLVNLTNVISVEHPGDKKGYILYVSHERHEPSIFLAGIGNNEQPKNDTSFDNRESKEPPDLVDALLDLHDAKRVAEEEGDIPPSDHLLERSESILRDIYAVSPRPYTVYPMPDGEIAIDAHTPYGTKLVVVCSDDSARCLVYTDEGFQQKAYGDVRVVPDQFMVEALAETQVRSLTTSRD